MKGRQAHKDQGPCDVPRRTDLTPRERELLPAHESGGRPARPSQPNFASPGREAIPVSTAGAPEGAAAPDRGSALRPCRLILFPNGSLGCPASPRLPPARKSPPGELHRKVALPVGDGPAWGCPRCGPSGTRAFLAKATVRPTCPWGDMRTRIHQHYGRRDSLPPPGGDRPRGAASSRTLFRRRGRLRR